MKLLQNAAKSWGSGAEFAEPAKDPVERAE
jgi:hypothetical protein